ncbi:MAG: hypothetical protein NVS2B14_09160 [Chamaesiphon sp.]
MDTNTFQGWRYDATSLLISLIKRMELTWKSLEAVWKLIELLDEEDPNTY